MLERIEAEVEQHLVEGDEEEYKRFLELYLLLDEDLTRKLAYRALSNPDLETKAAGQDFIEILKDKSGMEETKKMLSGVKK